MVDLIDLINDLWVTVEGGVAPRRRCGMQQNPSRGCPITVGDGLLWRTFDPMCDMDATAGNKSNRQVGILRIARPPFMDRIRVV
jgi:hypothetical protein